MRLAGCLIAGWLSFVVGKIVFMVGNYDTYSGIHVLDIFRVIGHGASMDFSMSAYLSVLPAILLCVSLFVGSRGIVDRILKIYYLVVALIVSLITVMDTGLYGYWHFKLDSTPLFYFMTSPGSALASVEWWMYPVGIFGWLLLAAAIYMIYRTLAIKLPGEVVAEGNERGRVGALTVMVLAIACLGVLIRGGLTVSTMNLSRAYFSAETRLNHAAVNPSFSLMYSLTHQDKFSEQFRMMDSGRAGELFALMRDEPSDSLPTLVRNGERPDIYIVILESFSSHLFPSLGGEDIAQKLDSIGKEGLVFTNFYASSFRTDRGLMAILSAYPGPPTTSLMKFVGKTEGLPNIAGVLKDSLGYSTTYYYGGDADFTNMRAYLINGGFERLISDSDFPVGQKLSKWGAHDDVLFKKVKGELSDYDSGTPKLKVIQTSSSHEPFEVDYDDKGRFSDKRVKAFAYADSCVADFINELRRQPSWSNSLILVVPDHYGAYPELTDPVARHRIPLIATGGALEKRGVLATVGNQTDIAATLLSSLGVGHEDFKFSVNMLNPESPHYAFFSEPGFFGMVTDSDTTLYNIEGNTPMSAGNKNMDKAKAYIQTLYDDISKR